MPKRHAFVLAGGKGTRLRPYTTILPKPLTPLGQEAIIEKVLRDLAAAGIGSATISLGYLGHLIEAVVEGGDRYGLQISYTREERPLGTAGALSLIPDELAPDDVVLVINGDTFTDLDMAEVIDWFEETEAGAAMVCVERDITIDYGVINAGEDGLLRGIDEKPTLRHTVSTGINLLRGRHIMSLPEERLDMPDLLVSLTKNGVDVRCRTVDALWMDLGRPGDLARANELLDEGDL